MRGLDTNVLLRFVTADDPTQTGKVRTLFTDAERTGERFFVSVICLSELSWTLRGRPYGQHRSEIADILETILGADLFEVQERDLVRYALADYRTGRADFADYVLGRQCLVAGCADTVTFDRKLKGAAGFSLLS